MKKKALLVGINIGPGYASCPLSGCVNDIVGSKLYPASLGERLLSDYGFVREDVRILTNNRATQKAILTRLSWLVDGAEPGDELLYVFSGHGVQLATRNPKSMEVDGMDECQCAADFHWDGGAIRDDDIAKVVGKLKPGVFLTVISDSCHSGDLCDVDEQRDRSIFGSLKRKLTHPVVARTMPLVPDIRWRNQIMFGKVEERVYRLAALANSPATVVWMEACRSIQTAADAWFSGVPRGAFSYCLASALDLQPSTKLSNLRLSVKSILERKGFRQEPVFEGAVDRPFLGGPSKSGC
jgi:metacaspase-1